MFRLLIEGTWGNAYGIGQVLYKTTTLVCTGLAFALAGRAGLFNVGAEGQLAAGGFGAAVLGLLLPAGTPLDAQHCVLHYVDGAVEMDLILPPALAAEHARIAAALQARWDGLVRLRVLSAD